MEQLVFSVFGLISLLIGFFLFRKFNILDDPKKYGFDRSPVPYGFGVILSLILLVGILFFLPISNQVIGVLVGLFILMVMTFVDDMVGLSPFLRFPIQALAAMCVVIGGGVISEVALPFGFGVVELGNFSYVLAVFWIVLITNLMNFLDGISGLSSGVSFGGFLGLVGLALLPGVHSVDQELVIVIGSILMGLSLVGFLLERGKPKLLLGDSGTMMFGFMLAVLSMINGGKLATLGLVLMVPLVDGVFVILARIKNKKLPWNGDFNHLHHLLLRHGYKPENIVLGYFTLSVVLALVSIYFWNSWVKFFALGLSFIGLLFVLIFGHKKYSKW